jgi:hypothetical protein
MAAGYDESACTARDGDLHAVYDDDGEEGASREGALSEPMPISDATFDADRCLSGCACTQSALTRSLHACTTLQEMIDGVAVKTLWFSDTCDELISDQTSLNRH